MTTPDPLSGRVIRTFFYVGLHDQDYYVRQFYDEIDYYVGQLTNHILLEVYLSQSTINHNTGQENDELGKNK